MRLFETKFLLDPRLHDDTLPIGDLALSNLRLMDDARFPWVVVIPRRPNLSELIDVSPVDRLRLGQEVDAVSRALQKVTSCDKLNVGALGNMVRQLHVHVVARFEADESWPHPVWSRGERRRYQPWDSDEMISRLRAELECA